MLTVGYGKTGTAPGTMTLTIPSRGTFGSLGAVPSDLDRSRAHLNYLPFYTGWLPGELTGGLGQGVTPVDYTDEAQVKAALAELEVHRARLAAEKEAADLKHTQSSRTWMIVGGIVGVIGLALTAWQIAKAK